MDEDFDCRQNLRKLFANFEETLSFLQFELKNIEIILQQPENYRVLIEILSETLRNSLFSCNKAAEFASNLSSSSVKLAEFFNCALFFVYFPLLLERKKKVRLWKSPEENPKQTSILAFFPSYCFNCNRRFSPKQKISPYRREFPLIICKDCQEIVPPYYYSDGSTRDFLWEIDDFLLDFCEAKLKEIRWLVQEKIAKLSNNEPMFCLDYVFKRPQWAELLIFSNILKDLLI